MSFYSIYCDESCHLEHDDSAAMALGCVWCKTECRKEIFRKLREIKLRHGLKPHCELKWNGVSPSKIDYYKEVTDFFFANESLHARILLVPNKAALHHERFRQTHDQFYYKMYFDLLKTLLSPKDTYDVYLDIKDTQGNEKVRRLRNFLCNTHYDFNAQMIQHILQVKSSDVELVQLADFLTGAVCYNQRIMSGNNETLTSQTKREILNLIKQRSGYTLERSTLYREEKFNLFVWKGKNA